MRASATKIVSLYERHAAAWTRVRDTSRFVESEWMKRFEALVPPGSTIADIGCGSARPVAEFFIREGFGVVGVDSSPTLIKTCRARFPDQTWLVADMRELALGRRFHGLIAWDSFFHLSPSDQRSMFSIFENHAAPHAALLFTTGPGHGEAMGSFEGEPLYHASLAPEEYRDLLRSHGFDVVSHEIEDPSCGEHTIWLAEATGPRL